MSTVVRKSEGGIIRRGKEKEDFLEPVFDSQSTAYNTFFTEYGINRFSLSSLLWMVRGVQYYQLRHVAVCGPDGRTQQEIPAKILFSKGGFFDGILDRIQPGSVILEALPTADSATTDPTGYIHSQVRGKGQFKLGYLATGVAETGKISIREGTIPSKTKYGEPMNVVYYHKYSNRTLTPLIKTKFCVESARRAYAKSLKELGDSSNIVANLEAFFDPLTEEEVKSGNFLDDSALLTIIERLRVMSGFKRKITFDSMINGNYPFKHYDNYQDYTALNILLELMDYERVREYLFDSTVLVPLKYIGAGYKSNTKRPFKNAWVQFEKIQEMIPGGHVTMCNLEFNPMIYTTRGKQSKSLFFTTTKTSFEYSMLKIEYDSDQSHNNAVEITRENNDKVYLTTIESVFMVFYYLSSSEESNNVKVINSFHGFPIHTFSADSVSDLMRKLYELGLEKTIEIYTDVMQELPGEFDHVEKQELLLKITDSIPLHMTYTDEIGKHDFSGIKFTKDQLFFDEDSDCQEINCYTSYTFKEQANTVMFQFDYSTAFFVICRENDYLCMMALYRAAQDDRIGFQGEQKLEIGTALLILNNHSQFQSVDFSDIESIFELVKSNRAVREDLLRTYEHLQYFDVYTYLTFWDFNTVEFDITQKVVEYHRILSSENMLNTVMVKVNDFKKEKSQVKQVKMKLTYNYKDSLQSITQVFLFKFETDLLTVVSFFEKMSEKHRYEIHNSIFFKNLRVNKFNLYDFFETLHNNFENIFLDMNSLLEKSLKGQVLLDYLIKEKNGDNFLDFVCDKSKVETDKRQFIQAYNHLRGKLLGKFKDNASFRFFNLLNKLTQITYVEHMDIDTLSVFNQQDSTSITKFLQLMETVTNDALPVVHVKNSFEETSFWNFCNGEVLDFFYDPKFFHDFSFPENYQTGTLFSLLVSIYTSLLSYVHSKNNFVYSVMDDSMKRYVTYFFSQYNTFRKFSDFVLKQLKMPLNDETILSHNFTRGEIELISLFLNLDIQIYELQDLQKSLCKNCFVISRKERYNMSLDKYHVFLDTSLANDELYAFQSAGYAKDKVVEKSKPKLYECKIRDSSDNFLDGKTLQAISLERLNFNVIIDTIIRSRLGNSYFLKKLYLEALNVLKEKSMLDSKDDKSWLNQAVDDEYSYFDDDKLEFWETNDMSLWKCQMMMQLIVSSHYEELLKFYMDDHYETYRPKNNADQYVRFNELFLNEFFDCFIKFIENQKDSLENFVLHPIDIEIISEYLDIGITFFQFAGYNPLLKCQKITLKKSKFEGLSMVNTDLPTNIPYANYTVNWQFGELHETENTDSYLGKNLVLYSDNDSNSLCYRLSTRKDIVLLPKITPDNLTRFSNSKQNWSHFLRFRCMFSLKAQIQYVDNEPVHKPDYQVLVSHNEMVDNVFASIQSFFYWTLLKAELLKEDNSDLCKSFSKAHHEMKTITTNGARKMAPKELIKYIVDNVTDEKSFVEYLKDYFYYIPIALFELIAMACKKRFVMVKFRTRCSDCRSVSDMFRIDDSCFDFFDHIDDEDDYNIYRDTKIFIVQPLRRKQSQTREDDESEFHMDTYTVCAVGALPSDVIQSLKETNEEDILDDTEEYVENTVESTFQLGVQNYLGTVKNDSLQNLKAEWVTAIPIHLLQPMIEPPNGLERFEHYHKMFATSNYQPIIMTHRTFPKSIQSYSIRNFPYKLIRENDENLYDRLESFTEIVKDKKKMKVLTNEFDELYDYETLASRYLQETTENKKHMIELKSKILPEDIKKESIETFSDILRCIRITLAISNVLNYEGKEVESKFFYNMSQAAGGDERMKLVFKIFGFSGSQDQNDFFSFRRDGSRQYYRASCAGIWNPKNVTMDIAMGILNYYIQYLELPGVSYIFLKNENDTALLEFLKESRDRWFTCKRQSKQLEQEKFIVKINQDQYDRVYRSLQKDNPSRYKEYYEKDIRTLSILYHFDFRILSAWGTFESNSFTDTPFTYLMQSTKRVYGKPTQVKHYTFENIDKQRKEGKPIETITNRFYRNINFPPWVRSEMQLEKIGETIYNTEKALYKKFANCPRPTVYLLPSKPEDSSPVIGHLFIKGKSVKLEELEYPEKIEDRWEPTQQDKEEYAQLKVIKDKRKEKKAKDKTKEDDKSANSEKGKKATVLFSGDCDNDDEWDDRKGDYNDNDEDFKYRADQGNFKKRGQMSFYRANGKRDTNVFQDQNGNLFRMGRNGRHYYRSEFSLGNSMTVPFNQSQAKYLSADAQRTVVYAEESNKEIHMLTLRLAHLIVGLDNLADGGYMTSKFNKGLLTQSRMLATMLLPCFDEVTAYPVPIFTDHILFAGKGFSRAKMLKHKVLDRLRGCMDLSENSVRREYETLMACYNDKASWGKFETRVDSCSEQLMYQSCLDDLKMAQVLIESTFSRDGNVRPGSGAQAWLDAATASAFNRRVFSMISREDRAANQSLLQALVQTDYGKQLRNVFAPVIAKLDGPRASPGRVELVDSDE